MAIFIVNYGAISIGIVLVLLVALCILIKPKYYILFWLCITPISNTIDIPGFEMTSYGLMNLLFLPILLVKIFFNYKKNFLKIPAFKSYFLFIFVVFAGIFYSSEPYFMGIRKWINFVIPVFFGVLMTNVLKEKNVLEKYLKTTLISVAIISTIGTIMYSNHKWILYLEGIPRAAGVIGHPNDYAFFLSMNLTIAISLAIMVTKKKDRILFLIIASAIAISIVPTFSKSAYLATSVSIFLVSILISLKYKTIRHLIIISLITLLSIGILMSIFSDIILLRLSNHGTLETRENIWKSVIHKFYEHPLIGNGFMSSFDMVQYLSPYRDLTSTHNLYLKILLESGIIGMATFLLFYFTALKYAFSVLTVSNKKYTVAIAVGLIAFSISSLLYSMTGIAFLSPIINLFYWFYFFFLIGFCKLENQQIKAIKK